MLIEFTLKSTFLNFNDRYNKIVKARKKDESSYVTFSAPYSVKTDKKTYENRYLSCIKFFDDPEKAEDFGILLDESDGVKYDIYGTITDINEKGYVNVVVDEICLVEEKKGRGTNTSNKGRNGRNK